MVLLEKHHVGIVNINAKVRERVESGEQTVSEWRVQLGEGIGWVLPCLHRWDLLRR